MKIVNPTANPYPSPLHQQGVTLIEALISIVVFSVGALGLAALQLTALSASGDSQQRSVAIWKAQELVDRIRGNPLLLSDYIDQIGSDDPAVIGVDDPTTAINCETTAGFVSPGTGAFCADSSYGAASECTDEEQVDYDVWEVFCEPNSGAAISGAASADWSVGLTGLEVVLKQNDLAVDGNDDVELYMEWLSREADATENITGNVARNVSTDLCGRFDVAIDSKLDVYCLRFRL